MTSERTRRRRKLEQRRAAEAILLKRVTRAALRCFPGRENRETRLRVWEALQSCSEAMVAYFDDQRHREMFAVVVQSRRRKHIVDETVEEACRELVAHEVDEHGSLVGTAGFGGRPLAAKVAAWLARIVGVERSTVDGLLSSSGDKSSWQRWQRQVRPWLEVRSGRIPGVDFFAGERVWAAAHQACGADDPFVSKAVMIDDVRDR